ncbi:heterokaryon incompatibility protein-domain-containing protein [Podospora appendiculata]|uniref:Heterokaryon incompatibility protein-domain-containing protein n=1 Tax=Podospora appendiculata TaxID=314037 RepID=A0AAE0XM34_9PEZI|nr:heterokaryon incompatibility protein-domain-containing protein [Podospora appendiculata]
MPNANWHTLTCTLSTPTVVALDATAWCTQCEQTAPVGRLLDLGDAGASSQIEPPPLPSRSPLGLDLSWPVGGVRYLESGEGGFEAEWRRLALIASGLGLDGEEEGGQDIGGVGTGVDGACVDGSLSSESLLTHPLLGEGGGGGDWIRLLWLDKGSDDDPVHATLQASQLANEPKFKAVSYAWADAAGDSSRKRAHLPRGDVVLWVDAVCIDQRNIRERNHQVSLMAAIYAAASEVLVYLGAADTASAMVLDVIKFQRQLLAPVEREVFRDFFARSYFYRTWVVQEIANAVSATAYCGERSVKWSMLFSAPIFRDPRLSGLEHRPLPWLTEVYTRPRAQASTMELLDFLIATWRCKASDPRDKVFALLGLVKDASRYGLVADYGLSTAEVYIGIAAFFLCHHGLLDVLKLCSSSGRGRMQTVDGLPSWAPDWSNAPDRIEERTRSQTRTTGRTPHEVHIHRFSGTLATHAKIIKLPRYDKHGNVVLELHRNFPGFFRGPSTGLDPERDAIAFFPGYDQLFHIRFDEGRGGICRIVGPCVVFLKGSAFSPRGTLLYPAKTLKHSVVNDIFAKFPLTSHEWETMMRMEQLLVDMLLGPAIDDTPISQLSQYTAANLSDGLAAYLSRRELGLNSHRPTAAICNRLRAWGQRDFFLGIPFCGAGSVDALSRANIGTPTGDWPEADLGVTSTLLKPLAWMLLRWKTWILTLSAERSRAR